MTRLIIIISLTLFISCGNTKLKQTVLTDKTVKFLWLENKQDDSYSRITINYDYCKEITDPERAALGFVATFIGNECWWDGEGKADRSNLKCKILTALDLGYQCSEQHLGFLRQWFRNDSVSLKKLDECPTIPYTSTIQDTFEEISITTLGNEISVSYQVRGFNSRDDDSWSWKQTDYFNIEEDNLRFIKSVRNN